MSRGLEVLVFQGGEPYGSPLRHEPYGGPRKEGKLPSREIPIVGRVAAGSPILAEENIEGYINLDEDLFRRSKDLFILRIVADSMIDEGIMNGDLVVVKPSSTIETGKICVVLLDDEATVKRIFIQRNKIALKPANKSAGYKTIYVKRGDKNVRIIGKVISCLRTNIN